MSLKKLDDKTNKFGIYISYLREIVFKYSDYIEYEISSNKKLKRDIDLSILLDNRNHPIFDEIDKLKEIKSYLFEVNIFLINENDTKKMDETSEEINRIISYIENIIE